MQIESHATPQQETPQQRYATLHRAIERGLDSDELWRELADVSLRLGHGDEAADCLRRIRDSVLHSHLEARLVKLGVIENPAVRQGLGRRPSVAPAASDAGAKGGRHADTGDTPRLGEHVVDALQYLFHQHMPWLVIVTTLAFPVVVGLGGFLTVGGSPLVLAAIAALPGLSVLAVVGAMGRQILLASCGGSADVPNVPELGQLVRDARTFLQDAGLVLGALLAPSLIAMALGAPLSTTLPGLLVGAFFTPLAWALRQIRGDAGSLSPVTLLRGVARCGLRYGGIVPVCWLLFAPAALTTWAVSGRPVWVQIAAVGPLCVVPLFVMSRLLGTWLDARRHELGSVLVGVRKPAQPVACEPTPPVRASVGSQPTARFPRRPEALEQFTAPGVKPAAALRTTTRPAAQPVRARAQAEAPRRAAAQRPPAAPAPTARRAPTAAQPAAPAARRPAPATRPAPPARAAREIEGRGPRRSPPPPTETGTDLTQMPGAVVLTGAERARHGAAARPRG